MSFQMQLEIEKGKSNERPDEEANKGALWGDEMTARTEQCRVVFNNVQGISTACEGIEISEIGKEVMENDVTILGMCETNRNWRDERSASEIKRRFREFWLMTSMATSYRSAVSTRRYNDCGR
jgi:hypothetical protein